MRRTWRKKASPLLRSRLLAWATAACAISFLSVAYALTPEAPGREAIDAYIASRTTDQHFANCSAVRAAGRENIAWFDPSYRPWMDGDGDGFACEPYRGL